MPKKSGKQQIASKSRYLESLFLRLEVGTIARIDEVLERFEDRSHMLREAIEREIKRRERQQRGIDDSRPKTTGPMRA
jgi:hypothetical protein